MRVLVTGLGLLGSQIVKQLAERGDEVVCFEMKKRPVDFLSSLWSERVRFVEGDIVDLEQLRRVAAEGRIDRLVHTAVLMNEEASRANPVRSFRVNVEGTLNVLEVVRERGIRAVCMSSQSVYGARPTLETIAPEDIRPWLGSLYATEKVMDEILIHSYRQVYQADVLVFRPNQMYAPAPTQFRTVLDQILMRVVHGVPVQSPSGGDFRIGWTYAPDMARAIIRALDVPTLKSHTFNVEEGRLWSVRELGQMVADYVPGAIVEIGPGLTMPGYSLPPSRGAGDITAALEELDLNPTPLPEGVQACASWYQTHRAEVPAPA